MAAPPPQMTATPQTATPSQMTATPPPIYHMGPGPVMMAPAEGLGAGTPVATPPGPHPSRMPQTMHMMGGAGGMAGYSPSPPPYNMAEFIHQTNERLAILRQHLVTPHGYSSAVKALLEWCSSPRSFSPPYEQGLMSCLQSMARVAASPGFDLELGYRLLNLCMHHRNLLSEKSAFVLAQWFEDLHKVMLSRQQRMMGVAAPPPMQPSPMYVRNQPSPSVQQMQPVPPYLQDGAGQPSVSVVAKVWDRVYPGAPSPVSSVPAHHTATPTQAVTPVMSEGQVNAQPYQQQQNPAQLAAAVAVAAAAATATATVAAHLSKDPPPVNQSPVDYRYPTPRQGPPPNRMVQQTGGLAPGSSTQPTMHQSQAAVFPSAAVSQQPTGGALSGGPYGPHSRPDTLPLRSPQGHPLEAGATPQYQGTPAHTPMVMSPAPSPMMAHSPYSQPPPNMVAQMQHTVASPQTTHVMARHPPNMVAQAPPNMVAQAPPNMVAQVPPNMVAQPPPNMAGPPNVVLSHNAMSHLSSPHQMAQERTFCYAPSQNHIGVPYQVGVQSPMATMAPVTTPMQVNGGFYPQQVKDPHHMLRLTFPLREGVLMGPLKLPHGVSHINSYFHLNEKIHPVLQERFDLELELTCYHDNERQDVCNWPAAVSVHVNNEPMPIDRGMGKSSLHRPLHIKRVCVPGRNFVGISSSQCCCSHQFMLRLVHRPSVKSVLQRLLQKRQLPEEVCKAKIKKHFTAQDDSVQQTAIRAPLRCPITYRRISIPARGAECHHLQCFDIESYLQMNCDRSAWKCPVCGHCAVLEGLEVDCFLWNILNKLEKVEDVEEVTLDCEANWSPVRRPPSTKGEDEDAPQRKKIRSASPSQPRSVGPPSSDSAPPTSATTTPSQPTPPQPLTEGAPHVGQRGGGAGGGGGQECPSGTSSQRATVATATGADSQEHVPVQHHEASSNVESYDFTAFLDSLPDGNELLQALDFGRDLLSGL